MTVKLAITGKGGSGKTTIVKAFMQIFREMFPEKSILLFDNDLTSELGHSFGLDIRNTIYGIRSGKHEYKTGIPEDMIKKAISLGVAKINVNTECQLAFQEATRKYIEEGKDLQGKGFDPRKLLAPGAEAIKATVKEKMELFGSVGKAE